MAKTKEQRMHDRLSDKAVCKLLLTRIENQLKKVPDILVQNAAGVCAWVELKALDKWPARETTLPLKNAFKKGQIPFSREWGSWKGNAFLLLRVGVNEWYLLDITSTRPERDVRTFTKDEIQRENLTMVASVDAAIDYLGDLEHKQ